MYAIWFSLRASALAIASVLVYRWMHGFPLLSVSVYQFAVASLALFAMLAGRRAEKLTVLSAITLSWIVASGAYHPVAGYMLPLAGVFAVLAVVRRSWTSACVVLVFIVSVLVNGSMLASTLAASPMGTRSVVIDDNSLDVMADHVVPLRVGCSRAEFVSAACSTSARHGVNPVHLLFVMWVESRIDPAARNPSSDARGLIQFMPRTSRDLGVVDHASLSRMSGLEQLDLVDRYLSVHEQRLKSCSDVYSLYLVVLYPRAVGKGDDFVFPDDVARANPVIFGSDHSYAAVKQFIDRKILTAGLTN